MLEKSRLHGTHLSSFSSSWRMCLRALRTDGFESLKPAAFVFGNIDIAFGIHGGTNGIEELALEEKTGAVANRRHDLPGCAIQDIDYPLVLIDDIYQALIWVARKLDRNRRSPSADLLHQGTGRESPPQIVAIPAKVFIFRGVVLPWEIDAFLEVAHLVERLQPVGLPVAHIDQPVIGQPHAMRLLLDVLFRLGVVQPPLAQKLSILIQHRNSGIPSTMAVGDVNISVLGIHIDSRGPEKLRRI